MQSYYEIDFVVTSDSDSSRLVTKVEPTKKGSGHGDHSPF